jgi:hypothetical protein
MTQAGRADTVRGASLYDVVALAADDAWRVGSEFRPTKKGRDFTLAEHWDGSGWTTVPTPNASNHDNGLRSVWAANSTDIWTVGIYETSVFPDIFRPLVLHWDGFTWDRVKVPLPDDCTTCALTRVTGSGPDDVWASGVTTPDDGSEHFFLEHWDGTQWTLMPPPESHSSGHIQDIQAVSSTDLWVAGFSAQHGRNFVDRWNGSGWKPLPLGTHRHDALTGLAVVDGRDAWMSADSPSGTPLALHWNGRHWRSVTTDAPAASVFSDVVGISGTDVWIVGTADRTRSLTEHWDGTGWHRVDSPNPRTLSGLWAVQGDAPDDVWAVGHQSYKSTTLHWDGTQWTGSR